MDGAQGSGRENLLLQQQDERERMGEAGYVTLEHWSHYGVQSINFTQ